jgi:hypothetical protein
MTTRAHCDQPSGIFDSQCTVVAPNLEHSASQGKILARVARFAAEALKDHTC